MAQNPNGNNIPAILKHSDWLDRLGKRDSSIHLLQRTLEEATRQAAPTLIAETRMSLIRHFARYQLRDSLEKNLDPLIDYAAKNGLNAIQAEALYAKAYHWLETQRYKQSLEICEQGNDLTRILGDERLTAMGLLCKGCVLRTSQNTSETCLPYFYQAIEVFREKHDTANIIRCANLISSGEQDSTKRADMVKLAVSLTAAYPSETMRMSSLNFKAGQLSPEKGIPLLEEAIRIAEKLRIPNMIQHLNLQLSNRYHALKQYDKAIHYMDVAVAAFPDNLPGNGGMEYYEIYKDKGDYQKAIQYMEQFRAYEDVRKQTDLRSFIAEWETKMNTREKDWELQQQKEELSNQRTRSLLLSLVLVLVVVAGGVSVNAFLRQKKARKLLAEQNDTIVQQSEELKSLEKLKSRFFANVSHELRTPLTLMLGPAHTLLKQDHWKETDRNLLQVIQRNGKHLLQLVNEILDLSKLETGRLEVKETAVNWLDALRPTIAQFSSYGDSILVPLHFDFRADPTLNLFLDTGKFEKIVHNFLSNAFKFTPKGGKVELIAEQSGSDLQITVRDNGQGIHPDDLPHIFDRFYQSKLPDAVAQGGTGIGLSLCRELAELLNGTVWAESTYGKGSAFYFRFPYKHASAGVNAPVQPVAEPATLAEAVRADSVEGFRTDRKARILMVEDNAELRFYMQTILEGFEVISAENGKVAIDLLNDPVDPYRPDLILSDLMMPVLDGFQLLEWVKSQDSLRHLPYIMLTARSDIQVKLRALRVGVDDYILKPFVEDELLARIHNLLAHHRRRLELHETPGPEPQQDPASAAPVLSEANARWLESVEQLMLNKLNDNNFNLDWIASEVHLSERQLRRKVQQLTGLTPNQYLQEMRLLTAKDFLFAGKYLTVKEVGFAVGYRDTSYFSTLFQERFGVNPSAYLRSRN